MGSFKQLLGKSDRTTRNANTDRVNQTSPIRLTLSLLANGFDGCIQREDGDGLGMAGAAFVVPLSECALALVGEAVKDDADLGHEWPILLRDGKNAVLLRED